MSASPSVKLESPFYRRDIVPNCFLSEWKSSMLGSSTFAVPVSNGDSRLFQRILDTAPEAMVLADAQGTILLVNQQAGTMFGYRPEEMLGQKIEILMPERFRASHPHRRADFSAHPHQRIITASKELYGLRKDGSEFSIEVSLNPIEADHGILISSTIVDVSDRKLAEQTAESRWKDRERYKDEFLSHVSHELRSPLTAIKQFSTILLTGLAGDLNQEQREYQQIVQKNILQLQSMIDDLLEVTRLDTGKLSIDLESISVSDSVIDVVQSLQELARKKVSASHAICRPVCLPSRRTIRVCAKS